MPARALRDEPPVAEHLQLPVIIWVALCGGAVGLGITGIDGFGPHAFTETGKFRLWLFLIGTQTALWALGAGVFQLLLRTSPLADVAYAARRTAWSATAAVGLPVLGFVAVATVASTLDYDLPGHKAKVTILSFLGAGVALMGVHALARVHFALRHKRLPATVRGIEAYLDLRAVIERVLAVEGAILGAAILASGALRNVVVASNGDKDSAFPKEDLLLYGAYFSLILVLVYAPVYQRLVATGRRLVDDACPGEEPSSPDWAASYDKRKKLEQLLELQLTTSGSFRAAVAISAPLVSSIVGLLLGKA